MRSRGLLGVLLCIVLVLFGLLAVVEPAATQEENLLKQGSFDEGYTARGRNNLNVPGEWGLWIADGPREFEWQNRADKVYIFPSRPFHLDGPFSLNIDGGFVTFTVALFQQVELQPGARLRASAWAQIRTCNLPRDDEDRIDGRTCTTSPESGAITRIGIDPDGGGNPLAPEIIWSEPEEPHHRFLELVVEGETTTGWATVFLYTTQTSPSDLNRVYWDNARLTYGGRGRPTALPTPSPTRDLPLPQPPLPDGSIIHTVQPNDTIGGLSIVYTVTADQILQLNNLADPRFLTVGQILIIRLPGG